MSIRVEPSELAKRLDGREFAYLVSTANDRAHVVALRCEVIGDRVKVVDVGRTTLRNIASNSSVTLVWPPAVADVELRDFSLVADGVASVDGDGVSITVITAVLHRPAP